MSILQDVANLVIVRSFLASTVNDESVKLTRDERKAVDLATKSFEKKIIELSLKVNLSSLGQETISKKIVRNSTEDVETVMKKFAPISRVSTTSTTAVVDETGMTSVVAPIDENSFDDPKDI